MIVAFPGDADGDGSVMVAYNLDLGVGIFLAVVFNVLLSPIGKFFELMELSSVVGSWGLVYLS